MNIKKISILAFLILAIISYDAKEVFSTQVTCTTILDITVFGWRYREWECTVPNPFGPGTITWKWYTLDWFGMPIWQESGPIEKKRIYDKDLSSETSSVKIYPNPTNDRVFINSEFLVGKDIKITLLDVNAREIAELFNSFNRDSLIELSLANFNSGTYFLKIDSDINTYSIKLLITK